MKDPDIVARFRTDTLAVVDEIVRLRHQAILLRAERDEARRMYCVMRDGEDGLNCKEWAERKNWDCFKENTDV
jgi:hypothetical protein